MNQSKFTSLAGLLAKPLPPGFDTATGPLPYSLLNDLMFRIVFEINPSALKALLCSLLHYKEEDIVDIEIKNPIHLGDRIDDKTCIFDINILLNNQKQIHLELQVLGQKFWTNRSLCYLCRNFGKINAGDDYNKIKQLIQIDILDFDLYENSKEFYSIYHLANDKSGRIYSDKIALHVLELNKEEYATEEDKAYHIDYWAKLFKATTWEELRMLAQEQQVLQSTVETIYRVNADDYVRAELEAREDGLRLQRTYDNEIKQQIKTMAEQQSTISEQRTTIDEQQSTIDEQKSTIDEQKSTIDEQKSTIDEQKSTIDEQKFTIDEQKSTIDEQKSTIDEQQSTIDTQNKELAAKDSYIAELEAKLKHMQSN